MRVVPKMPPLEPKRTRANYNHIWAKIFDGQIWELKRYEDFQVSASSMRSGIVSAANHLRYRLNIQMSENVIYVQKIGNW